MEYVWEVLVRILIGFAIITAISAAVLFGVWLKRKIDGPYAAGNAWMKEERRRAEAGEEGFSFEERMEFWLKESESWGSHDHIQMHKDMGDFDGWELGSANWKRLNDEESE